MEDIKKQPWNEICWYFPHSREQFRLGGELLLVGEDHPDEQLRKVCLEEVAIIIMLLRNAASYVTYIR